MVLEAAHIGHGASSRNGGFCDSSLTHGLHNGALVDPARLAWGLADVVGTRGATVHDSSAVTAVEPDGRHLVVHTPDRRGGRFGIGFDS